MAKHDDRVAISSRIRDLRAKHHLTQQTCAEKCGVTLRAYQEWEAGGGITYDNLRKLARVLRTTPEFILNGPEVDMTLDPLSELRAQLDEVNAKLDVLLRQQDDPQDQGA